MLDRNEQNNKRKADLKNQKLEIVKKLKQIVNG